MSRSQTVSCRRALPWPRPLLAAGFFSFFSFFSAAAASALLYWLDGKVRAGAGALWHGAGA